MIIPSKPGRTLHFYLLWKNLLKELQLYDLGEPYWFCDDSFSLILQWLDEVLTIDQQQSKLIRVESSFHSSCSIAQKILQKIAHTIPSFHPPRFIPLPACYSELLQLCTHLHCSHCRKPVNEPVLCLICGIVYSQERTEQKCCSEQTQLIKEVRCFFFLPGSSYSSDTSSI